MFFSLLFEVLSNVQKQFGHYLKRKIRKSLRIATKCITFAPHLSPDGGIGRRAGLKHQWINLHAGSIPALGTKIKAKC